MFSGEEFEVVNYSEIYCLLYIIQMIRLSTYMRSTLTGCLLVVVAIGMSLLSPTAGAQIAVSGSRPASFGGGKSLRSSLLLPTLRVGTFDKDSALMAIDNSQDRLLRTWTFAHKQHVNVNIINDGHTGASTANSRVWQYRVTSPGAKSIGLCFEDFYLPEGALLFVYSTDRRQVIGGFGSANNSDTRVLSVQPIFSDDIVIEVVAPVTSDRPRMRLTEVNHALYDIRWRAFGQDYGGTNRAFDCTPEVVCVPNLGSMPRCVVLLVFDGIGLGTGAMVNNTKGDRRPLLLTAAHVPSSNFKYRNYNERVSKMLTIFNYQSPTCSGEVQPSLTQSVSGGKLIAVDEGRDACLIELNSAPPEDYKVYYSGWNAEAKPHGMYTNIHHPMLQPKSVNIYYGELRNVTFPNEGLPFDPHMHWEVEAWDLGTTARGSSGSPLFDKNGRIVGGLSGGNSFCSSRGADYFFSLYNVWDSSNPESQKLVQALDPSGLKGRVCDGSESSVGDAARFVRVTHISEQYNPKSLEQSLPQLSREELLGNTYGTTRISERYEMTSDTEISGVYVVMDTKAGTPSVSPPMTPVELQIFTDDNQNTPIVTQTVDLSSVSEPMKEGSNRWPRFRELYIPLSTRVTIPREGAVYFALTIAGLPPHMSVVHKNHSTDTGANTLYRHIGSKNVPAPSVSGHAVSASLWIDPVVYSKQAEQQVKDLPLITLTPLGATQVLLTFAERVQGQEARVSIYSLLGQRLYEHTLSAGTLVLDRAAFEGRGVLVLRAQCGAEKMSLRVLFPSN